jgi:hypothetical protein
MNTTDEFGKIYPNGMSPLVGILPLLMPAKSEKQQKFMGAELARKRAGEKTQTGMSEEQLADFARKTKYAKAGKARKPK